MSLRSGRAQDAVDGAGPLAGGLKGQGTAPAAPMPRPFPPSLGGQRAPTMFCQGHARFTDDEAVHMFRVQDEVIALAHHPEVFPPSCFGLNFAERIDYRACRRAADIGTGTGLLAVLAARKGVPEIKATDVSDHAVRLADHNARTLNGIDTIETRCGPFFADFTGAFDVITANLPQEIIPPAYRAALSRTQGIAIDGGGAGGNAILLDFLDTAPSFMHAGSRLYVIVNTITDYRQTLRKIDRAFEAVLVWEGATSAKAFVRDNIDFFRDLIEAGTVALDPDSHGDWHARQMIFRLALKSRMPAMTDRWCRRDARP